MNIGMTVLEERLLESSFNEFNITDKNQLIAIIAKKENKMYYDITKEYILDYHKKMKIDSLSNTCEDEIIKGFISPTTGHHYRCNRDDQVNMIGQRDDILSDETITVVYWKTEDEGYVEHTVDEWMAIYKEAYAHKKDNLIRYDFLKKKIKSATSHEEILPITWEWEEPVEEPAEEIPSEPTPETEGLEQIQNLVGDEGNADSTTI